MLTSLKSAISRDEKGVREPHRSFNWSCTENQDSVNKKFAIHLLSAIGAKQKRQSWCSDVK